MLQKEIIYEDFSSSIYMLLWNCLQGLLIGIEISPFELKDTIVALIYTNPWRTSNGISRSYCSKLVTFFVVIW